jgi:hypothetical protein
MTDSLFDLAHAVRFDLASGSVRAQGQEDRLVLLPAKALENLLLYASAESGVALGKALGESIGKRVAARIGATGAPSVDDFATALAGEAAVAGIGVVSFERWGRALVVVIEHSALPVPLLAPVVGAALEAASGRTVYSALLAHEGHSVRVLVASPSGIDRVRGWIASGISWGDALVKLQGGGS